MNSTQAFDDLIGIKDLANKLNVEVKTIHNWKSDGFFVEGLHYKKVKNSICVFYKKAILDKLGIFYNNN
jgi:hypothetical protein